jgi:hypothetical protein
MFAIALFLVIPVLWLLVTNWQLTLLGLGVWILVRALAAKYPGGRAVGQELPGAAYLPRWTRRRRMDAKREHAQWQEWFDASR